jgi:hypothetical protein
MYILKYMDVILQNISVTKRKGRHFMVFQDHPEPSPEGRMILPLPEKRWRVKMRALFWTAYLPLILMSGLLVNWIFLAQIAFAAPAAPYSTPGHNCKFGN